jgi:hypothetical protein
MAVTSLSQQITDWWKAHRPGVNTDPNATMRTGLVSDLVEGDFLVGARATVQPGSGAGGGSATVTRALVLRRRGEVDYTVNWINGSTVWFLRV